MSMVRSCIVEIDKTVDTCWPPKTVIHHNREFSIESIHESAGFALQVRRGDTNLALPETGVNFDLAQLHKFMTRHRKRTTGSWHAHVLVVPNIEYQLGLQKVRPVGVMYDHHSNDPNSTPREGCAISFRTVSSFDERAYLRTLCHELGHVFNLVHPKDESSPRPVSTSIMNQTRDLQQLGTFPDNICFEFESFNAEWLRAGPANYVRPGGKPFGSRPDHRDVPIEADIGAPPSAGLTFEISTRRPSYQVGEPFYIRFSLKNSGGAPAYVDPCLSLHNHTVLLDVTDPSNNTRRFHPLFFQCSEEQAIELPPGTKLRGNSAVSHDACGQVFDIAGMYKLRAMYVAHAGGQFAHVMAEELAVEILPTRSQESTTLADATSIPDVGLFFVLRGGDHLFKAADVWRRFVVTQGNTPFTQSVKLVLAQNELSCHRGRAAAQRAIDLLKSTMVEDLDLEQRAERAAMLGVTAGRLGHQNDVDNARGEWRDIAAQLDPTAVEIIDVRD